MAFIVACMSEEEMRQIQDLGHTLEEAPKELIPKRFDLPKQYMKMVWVDCSMLDLLKTDDR